MTSYRLEDETSECVTGSKLYQVQFALVVHERKVQNNRGLNQRVCVSYKSPEMIDQGHRYPCKIQTKLPTLPFPSAHTFMLLIWRQ